MFIFFLMFTLHFLYKNISSYVKILRRLFLLHTECQAYMFFFVLRATIDFSLKKTLITSQKFTYFSTKVVKFNHVFFFWLATCFYLARFLEVSTTHIHNISHSYFKKECPRIHSKHSIRSWTSLLLLIRF